jgi:putative peptidoglycan lipid II flippase
MMLAWRFGAYETVDAYRIAMLLVVVGAQLFLGNLLPHVVVPMFAEYRAKGMEQEGWRLAFSLAAILSVILLAFIAWIWIYPDTLVELLGPGLSAMGRDEASLLLRCFSLALFPMVWSGVTSGILYVQRVFWLSALVQIVPNLCVVLAVAIAGGVESLVLGVLPGYAAMLVLFGFGLLHAGRRARVAWDACLKPMARAGLGKAWRLAWPLLAGTLIGQWGVIVINRALSGLPPGTLAEFGYAWKLLALVGLLPAGLATVIFPAFSDAHANGDAAEFSRLSARALRMTLLLTMPLAVGLFVERLPVVDLLFGRGSMSPQALDETGRLFGILLAGAPAGAFAVALNKIAFAMHDTKSPTVFALLSWLAFPFFATPV